MAQTIRRKPTGVRRQARAQGIFEAQRGDRFWDLRRADVLGHPVGVLGVEIVEARLGHQFGHRQRARALGPVDDRGRQFAAADIGFGQQLGEFLPRPLRIARDRVAVIALGCDDGDPDRRSLVDRFQHVRARQRVLGEQFLAAHDAAAGHGDAVGHERLLGQFLVDRDDRGGEARMRIGHAHQVEHALHRAVFARHAVKRVEHDIGRGLGNARGDLPVHIDPRHAIAVRLERLGDAFARHQRNGALVRPAAHQDGDVEFGLGAHGRPTRWISHSSITPESA